MAETYVTMSNLSSYNTQIRSYINTQDKAVATAAKKYTDQEIEAITPESIGADPAGAATDALIDANAYTDEAIAGLTLGEENVIETIKVNGTAITPAGKTVDITISNPDLTDYAKKTDIPTTLPASDVEAWAKATTKPTYTATEVGADVSGSAATAESNAKAYTDQKIADKVDKVAGKDLSTNDFTDTYKSAIDNLPSSYAPTNAEENVINEIKVNGTAVTPNAKSVDITIPDGFSGDYNDLSNKPSLFSGSYNDLTDKPTPVTASDVYDATSSDAMSGIAVASALSSIGGSEDKMNKTNPTGTGTFSLNRSGTGTIGNYSVAIGCSTTSSGSYSYSEGYKTTASGESSHAEGDSTTASGVFCHAEGYGTVASQRGCHAEGINTKAINFGCHAEGDSAKASGSYTHAEGSGTTASGNCSHAEGSTTTASGNYSHTEGVLTTASNNASHACGKYNAAMTDGGDNSNTTGTAFVIGNGRYGALSNAFSVQFNGTVKAKSTITGSTTADYAEFFEWLDENPDNEDRVGYFVTLDGDKIRIATNKDEYILGIVSGEPFVLGNGDCDTWGGMYLHDEFRRTMYEPAPKVEEIFDEYGCPTGELKEIEGEFNGTRPVLNPDYDQSKPYISRFDRKEWSPIGMLGVLAVRHDGSAKVNGYVTVNKDGIATACDRNTENSYRVIKSNTESVVEVIFR